MLDQVLGLEGPLPPGAVVLVKDTLSTPGSFLVPYFLRKALAGGWKARTLPEELGQRRPPPATYSSPFLWAPGFRPLLLILPTAHCPSLPLPGPGTAGMRPGGAARL